MHVKTGWDVLQHELLEEQAATIGRLGRALREALDALNAFDGQTCDAAMAGDRRDPRRARLVDDAAYALWRFVVQRDCSGLRFTEKILEDYAVPAEVRAKMGVKRPR